METTTKDIKYCRSKTGKIWYVYGFKFRPAKEFYDRCIVCYDKDKISRRTNAMYVVEGDVGIRSLLFSEDIKDHVMANVMLNNILKTYKPKLIIDPLL